jgi:hypothetical protein
MTHGTVIFHKNYNVFKQTQLEKHMKIMFLCIFSIVSFSKNHIIE